MLVDAAGKETPLPPEKELGAGDDDGTCSAGVKLPALPDGDYRLRARVTSPLGTDTVDAPLALYAPARVHVLTDRPLYEPGHQVRSAPWCCAPRTWPRSTAARARGR